MQWSSFLGDKPDGYQELLLLKNAVSINIECIVLLLSPGEDSKLNYPVLTKRSLWKAAEATR